MGGQKQCRKCKETKPLNEFHKNKRMKDGYRYNCKECRCQYENTDARRAYQKEYENKPSRKKKMRGHSRRYILKKYGLTQDDFNTMLKEQTNKCKICEMEFTKTPHIDHCHETGVVRGLLCQLCNTSLGGFKDNPDILRSAINYLQGDLR